MYFAAKALYRLPTLHRTNPVGMLQPSKKGKFKQTHHTFPSFASSVGHSPTTSTSTSSEPQPMDLDAFETAPPRGPTQPSRNVLRVRCFNCNRMGHYSRNCRAPRKPRPQALNLMDVDDEDDSDMEPVVFGPVPMDPSNSDDDLPSLVSCSRSTTVSRYWADDDELYEDSDSPSLASLSINNYDNTYTTVAEWGADTPPEERDAQVDDSTPLRPPLIHQPPYDAHTMEVDPPPPEMEVEIDVEVDVDMLDAQGIYVLNLDDGADSNQDLPVYRVLIPLPNRTRGQFRCITTIIDSGAASCYVLPTIVRDLALETYPITCRMIRGAGTTSTSVIARFSIKIGGIVRPIIAYILDRDCLRYSLVLGQDWMRRHNAQPDWNTSSWYLTDPQTAQTVRLAMEPPCWLVQDPPPPPYVAPPPYTPSPELYSATSNELLDCLPMHTSREHCIPVREQLTSTIGTLGDKLQNLAKKRFPKLFGTKVRYGDIPARRIMHTIDTRDAQPVCAQGRPHSPPEHEEIEKFVEEALEDGLIEPSTSPWSAPIIFAKKKDGTNRLCVDYGRLNDITIKNAYPLPRIDDTYQYFHGAKFFTTLDLKSGYWQIPVHPDSREKTAFAHAECDGALSFRSPNRRA